MLAISTARSADSGGSCVVHSLLNPLLIRRLASLCFASEHCREQRCSGQRRAGEAHRERVGQDVEHLKMTSVAKRRLMKDLRKMQNDPPSGVTAAPLHELFTWQAVIFGPDDTPWEGGTFNLVIRFAEDYPSKPPDVRFVSSLFHPGRTRCRRTSTCN